MSPCPFTKLHTDCSSATHATQLWGNAFSWVFRWGKAELLEPKSAKSMEFLQPSPSACVLSLSHLLGVCRLRRWDRRMAPASSHSLVQFEHLCNSYTSTWALWQLLTSASGRHGQKGQIWFWFFLPTKVHVSDSADSCWLMISLDTRTLSREDR